MDPYPVKTHPLGPRLATPTWVTLNWSTPTGCERVTVTPNNCVISWDRGVFSGLWVNQPFKILSALRICPISID